MFGWLGQLRALWDTAGQLVELRDQLGELNAELQQLRADMDRLDERTRKQNYRERKESEDVAWRNGHGNPTSSHPNQLGSRAAIRHAAVAQGLIREHR